METKKTKLERLIETGTTHIKCNTCGENKHISEYYITNASKCSKCCSKHAQAYQKQNKIILSSTPDRFFTDKIVDVKHSAKTRNKYFELTAQDLYDIYIKQNKRCVKLNRAFADDGDHYTLSVDRIDSKKGYVKDNVQLICTCVNRMKNNMSESEFEDNLVAMVLGSKSLSSRVVRSYEGEDAL